MIVIELLNIISSFLLPPGLFISIFLVVFFIHKLIDWNIIKVVIICNIMLLYLFSTGVIVKPLMSVLETQYFFDIKQIESYKKADYLVILGGGIIENSPAEYFNSDISSDALNRLIKGIILSKELNQEIIYSGGSSLRIIKGKTEAETARRFAEKLGVKSENFHTEAKSHSTEENAFYTKEIYDPESIVLVTSAYHMPRSLQIFTKNGMIIYPFPVDFKYSYPLKFGFDDLLPNIDHLKNCSIAFREFLGLLLV